MSTEKTSWLGKHDNTLGETAFAVGLLGTTLDIIHMSNYPASRQQLIDVIGPVGEYIGNFSC